MKLSGNKRSGRHLLKNVDNPTNSNNSKNGTGLAKAAKRPRSKLRRAVQISAAVLGILIVSFVAAEATGLTNIIRNELRGETDFFLRPPTVNRQAPRSNPSSDNTNQPSSSEVSELTETVGDESKLTFLVFGLDEGEANTDVIMVASFDTVNKTLDVISIPRDTLVNVEWNLKLANSVLPNMRNRYRSETDRAVREELAMQATVESFADILGFEVDFWISVNMRAFRTLIDAVGGVDFYIPVNMNYTDSHQNLRINYRRGMHTGLTGQQALEILRYRSFANADIGRIAVQQQFLTSAVEQILEKRDSISIWSLAGIALEHVRTNLSLNELAWLGLRFLELEPENIRFDMIPAFTNEFVHNRGYVVIDVEAWLPMLNERLSPFFEDKTAEDLSILTWGSDRRLIATDGNQAGNRSWGASSRGPQSPSSSGATSSLIVSGGGGGSSGSGGSGGSSSGSSSGTSRPPSTSTPSQSTVPTDSSETTDTDPLDEHHDDVENPDVFFDETDPPISEDHEPPYDPSQTPPNESDNSEQTFEIIDPPPTIPDEHQPPDRSDIQPNNDTELTQDAAHTGTSGTSTENSSQ